MHKNNKNKTLRKYSLYDIITLRYSDPINAMAISNKNLLLGSIMGTLTYYTFIEKEAKILNELSNECISGVSFSENDNIFYCSIGDEEVFQYQTSFSSEFPQHKEYFNYDSIDSHISHCDSSFTMLNNNQLLILFLEEPRNNNSPITQYSCSYTLYSFEEDRKKDKGNILLSNFTVPFDFFKGKFLYLEHLKNKKRKISIYDMNNMVDDSIHFDIDKSFGHISFMKLLPEERFLLVRNYKIIEIYNNKFNREIKFEYSNSEIEAIDYYEDEDNIIILIIDEDGNCSEFGFDNGKVNLLGQICLYDIKEIPSDIKLKKFFFFDFPYYIKGNKNYIAITTDYACFILQRD